MTVLTYTIQNEEGLHARPATDLVRLAATFKGTIEIEYRIRVNMKSMLMVLSLGIFQGETFKIYIDGEDEHLMKEKIEDVLIREKLI